MLVTMFPAAAHNSRGAVTLPLFLFAALVALLAYEQLLDGVAHARRARWERLLRAIGPLAARQS